MIFERELQRITLFIVYNLQEIASGTPMVNNFEMGAVGKPITRCFCVANSIAKKKQSSIISIPIVKHPYTEQLPKCVYGTKDFEKNIQYDEKDSQ